MMVPMQLGRQQHSSNTPTTMPIIRPVLLLGLSPPSSSPFLPFLDLSSLPPFFLAFPSSSSSASASPASSSSSPLAGLPFFLGASSSSPSPSSSAASSFSSSSAGSVAAGFSSSSASTTKVSLHLGHLTFLPGAMGFCVLRTAPHFVHLMEE